MGWNLNVAPGWNAALAGVKDAPVVEVPVDVVAVVDVAVDLGVVVTVVVVVVAVVDLDLAVAPSATLLCASRSS